MGAKLLEFYDKANKIGGMKAKMRLAILTLMPTAKAETADDSQENISKFNVAMNELEKEFK